MLPVFLTWCVTSDLWLSHREDREGAPGAAGVPLPVGGRAVGRQRGLRRTTEELHGDADGGLRVPQGEAQGTAGGQQREYSTPTLTPTNPTLTPTNPTLTQH